MNLKFEDIQLTEDSLMYVKFKLGEKELKWFPKWDDLAWLMACAQEVEEIKSAGSWRIFFEIMGCQAIITSIIERVGNITPESTQKIMESFTELRRTFWANLDKKTKG